MHLGLTTGRTPQGFSWRFDLDNHLAPLKPGGHISVLRRRSRTSSQRQWPSKSGSLLNFSYTNCSINVALKLDASFVSMNSIEDIDLSRHIHLVRVCNNICNPVSQVRIGLAYAAAKASYKGHSTTLSPIRTANCSKDRRKVMSVRNGLFELFMISNFAFVLDGLNRVTRMPHTFREENMFTPSETPLFDFEPVKRIRTDSQLIWLLYNLGKHSATKYIDKIQVYKSRQIHRRRNCKPRYVCNDQKGFRVHCLTNARTLLLCVSRNR